MQYRLDLKNVAARDGGEPASPRSDDAALDEQSARDLDLFLSAVEHDARGVVSRPVVVHAGGRRLVFDLHVQRLDRTVHLELGEQRADDDAPDRARVPDPRLDELTTMVWSTDKDRLARWFNRAWLTFVGAELGDQLGWGWMGAVHPDDLLGLLERYEEAQEQRHGFEHVLRVRDASGRFRWTRVRATPRLVDGGFDGFVGMCEVVEPTSLGARPVRGDVAEMLPAAEVGDEPVTAVVERLARIEAALGVARPARTVEAAFLRRLASRWAAQHDALRARHDEIVLAVGEAAANCALHAYRGDPGLVHLGCELREHDAEFRVRDWGTWRAPDPARDSRGLMLMGALSDALEINRLPDGTEIVLRYALPDSDAR